MGTLAFIQTIKSTAAQNLTTLGGLDWRHWSGFSLNSSTRKTGGAGISDLSAIGSITADQASNSGRTVTASDPTLNATSAGIYFGANGTTGWGVRCTINVGTTKLKCYLLIGQFSSATKIDISLSDSSASPISFTYTASAPYATEGMLVEFELQANSAGQTATVDITCSTNVDFGRTGVQAITLSNAASGNVFNETQSESVTATDTNSSVKATAAARVEATTATDTTASIKTTASANTEAATATDTSASIKTTGSSVAETTSATDSQAGSKVSFMVISETISANDLIAAAATFAAAANEPTAANDAQSAIQTTSAAQAETVSATDQQTTGAQAQTASQSESANATDQLSRTAILICVQSENATPIDAAGASKIAPAAQSESVTATDTQGQGSFATADQVETATATDTISKSAILVTAINEAVNAQDLVGAGAVFFSSLLESLAAIDQQSAAGLIFTSVIEATTATDTVIDLSQQIINAEITETGFAVDVVFVNELEYDGRYVVAKVRSNYIASTGGVFIVTRK